MEIKEIIEKWSLNKSLLASKIGMSKQTFQNKLETKFTEDESILLRSALVELRNDLEGVNDIDFNEAMRIISQKKV